MDYLTEQVGIIEGFGASSMPDLIIARPNALLKLDGHPYIPTLNDGLWHLLISPPRTRCR